MRSVCDYQTSVLTSNGEDATRTRHLEACYEHDAKIDEQERAHE